MGLFGNSTALETYEVDLGNGNKVSKQLPAGLSDGQVRAAFSPELKAVGWSDPSRHDVQRPLLAQSRGLAPAPPSNEAWRVHFDDLVPTQPWNEAYWRAVYGDQGSISAYRPDLNDRISLFASKAHKGLFGGSQQSANQFGRDLVSFLAILPIPNLNDIFYGSETERDLPMLPVPGPARKGVKLTLDEASRLARASEQGYRENPFWRGEKSGVEPNWFYPPRSKRPDGTSGQASAWFSNSPDAAQQFTRAGGPAAREFRLRYIRPLVMDGPVTARDYGDVMRAMEREPGQEWIADFIAKGVDRADKLDLYRLAADRPGEEISNGRALFMLLDRAAPGRENFLGILRRAGFDAAIDGHEVAMLTNKGIRLKSAAFDPRKARHTNIHKGLLPIAIGAGGASLYASGSGNPSQ
jgi:hypothetical protein